MADPRELSGPELTSLVARLLDRALSPTPTYPEPDGWRIESVRAEPDGSGLWVGFGRMGDLETYSDYRFVLVSEDSAGQ